MSFLKRLFQPAPPPAPEVDHLSVERELQTLRLELAEQTTRVATLESDLERARDRLPDLAREQSNARLEALFSDLAAPASQLVTQSALLEAGKDLSARDVLTVARRMLRALERQGLELTGKPGDRVPFDPAGHQPMNAGTNPLPGQEVIIRFPAVLVGGKMIYKAIIE
jgi:molecular chaperone GrpE (heat shock protein)